MIVLYLIRVYFILGGYTTLRRSMSGKLIIVTGSSAGIGKATALQFLEDGAEIVFACRDKEKTHRVFEQIKKKSDDQRNRCHFIELNLSSFQSVHNFVKTFKQKFQKLDILVNNAATFPTKFTITEDCIEETLQTNHLSVMLLTTLLLDHFDKKEGRIINVASFAHIQSDWTVKKLDELRKDFEFKSIKAEYWGNMWLKHYHYANSKIGTIFFTSYLGDHLEKNYPHIKTACMNPGVVYTEMHRFIYENYIIGKIYDVAYVIHWYISKTAIGGAQSSLHLCYLDFSQIVNGGYYNNCKLQNASETARNKEIRGAAMNFSWELIQRPKKVNDSLTIF